MSGRYLTELADIARYMGLDVVEVPGWETRARRSGGFPYVAGMSMHHTAETPVMDGAASSNYMTFAAAARPISNVYISRAPKIYIQAAGATNTVGAGGPYHGIGVDQGNATTIGVEIGNNGVGEHFNDDQVTAAVLFCAGVWAFYGNDYGWGIEMGRIFAHYEWAPTRKIDPRGPSRVSNWENVKWDMSLFRAEVASIVFEAPQHQPETPLPDPPPPSADPDVNFIETGVFTLRPDCATPWSIAAFVYGDPRRHQEISDANPEQNWQIGNKIWVPGRAGWWVQVRRGDGWYSLLGRTTMPKNQDMINKCLLWNGNAALRPDDYIFIPNQ